MRFPGRLVLLGHPVAHSLSPIIHNAALAAAGIDMSYEAIDVAPRALGDTLLSLAGERAAGNVTVPHKEAATGMMAAISASARRIGAVNTFHASGDGGLVGDNTDAVGFATMIRAMLGQEPRGAHFAVIGAGGAAAAVLATVEEWRCSASVYSRNRSRAEHLVARFRDVARTETLPNRTVIRCDIIVNATPIGLDSDDLPVPIASVERNAIVVDLAYKRDETAWVRLARADGRIASDGLPMLVEQGAAAFQIWFGVEPDRDAMWSALKKATGRE